MRPDLEPGCRRRADLPHEPNGIEISAAWRRIGEQSGRKYAPINLAASAFGPGCPYATLGHAAGQDNPDTLP